MSTDGRRSRSHGVRHPRGASDRLPGAKLLTETRGTALMHPIARATVSGLAEVTHGRAAWVVA